MNLGPPAPAPGPLVCMLASPNPPAPPRPTPAPPPLPRPRPHLASGLRRPRAASRRSGPTTAWSQQLTWKHSPRSRHPKAADAGKGGKGDGGKEAALGPGEGLKVGRQTSSKQAGRYIKSEQLTGFLRTILSGCLAGSTGLHRDQPPPELGATCPSPLCPAPNLRVAHRPLDRGLETQHCSLIRFSRPRAHASAHALFLKGWGWGTTRETDLGPVWPRGGGNTAPSALPLT